MNSGLPGENTNSWEKTNKKGASKDQDSFFNIINKAPELGEESILLNLFENSPAGISITKINGDFFVNKAFCDILGYTPEELKNKNWRDISYSGDIKKTEEQIDKLLNNETHTARFDKRYVHKNGKIIWADVSTFLKKDLKGINTHFVTTIIDITEKKRYENILRNHIAPIEFSSNNIVEEKIPDFNTRLNLKIKEATNELQDLYNNAPCGYHSLNKEGYFEMINDTELNWLGYTREELIHKIKFTDLITPESVDIFNQNFPLFKQNGYINDLEFEMIRKDGSILSVIVQASAIYDSNGNYLKSRSSLMNNSQHKESEKMLLETHSKLEAANKELEAFSYSVSHDLRAPLRAITGFARILLEDYGNILDNEGVRVCNVIVDNTDKMGKLIDDLLSFSRLGRSEKHCAEMDMKGMILKIFEDIATPELFDKTNLKIDKDLPAAFVDQSMIQQVWINLISNALKYSAKNKKINIEIGYKSETGKTIYYIKDNGVGFEMAYADKLFGVFQRLHNLKDFEGTGVGLAIVKRIIEKHGGSVWAESWPGLGATFYFSIPKSISYE
jgi:PAS domain S-box-containing protein